MCRRTSVPALDTDRWGHAVRDALRTGGTDTRPVDCGGGGETGQEAAAVLPPDEETTGFAAGFEDEDDDDDEDDEVEADESEVEDVEEDVPDVVPASVLVAVERESLR